MKVLITDPIHISCLKILEENGFDVFYKPEISRKELFEEIKDKHACIVRGRTKLDKEIISVAKELKLIVRAGVGLDNIDVNFAKSNNIAVFNTPEAVTNAVAELTVCLILDILRGVSKGNEALKRGEWIKNKLIGRELKGKNIGILGFGRIGYEVAKKLKAFECRIIAYSRSDKSEIAKNLGIEFTRDLDYLLSNSDIITVHLTLDSTTYKFLDKKRLLKIKKGAYIINTSRGAIIDEEALLELLEAGHIAGVALDVFEIEPPTSEIEKKLLSMDNVVATPHIGAQTFEAMEEEAKKAAEIVVSFFKNKK